MFLSIVVIISGCSIYRDYPFEYYERSGPRDKMEFNMKDGTIHEIESKHIALIKNSQDYYTIYFKNGQNLVLNKEEISSVKMLDEKRTAASNIVGGAIVGVIIFFGIILLARNISWFR